MFNQYVLILVWIFFMAVIANSKNVCKLEYVCGRREWRVHFAIAIIAMLPLVIMTANRSLYLGDTLMYQVTYQEMPECFSDIPLYIREVPKDKGFYLCSAIIKVLFGTNYRAYFLIIALLQGFALVKLYQKYSMNYILSIFLFIVSTDYMSWMFNGMRQFTAVAITLFVAPYILHEREKPFIKKYLPFLLIVILASTMHQSALLAIPFILIAQGKAWNKKSLLFVFMALVMVLFVDRFTNILDEALSTTQYTNVVSDYTSWNDDGTNPVRVLIYAIPTILSFLGRKIIQAEDNVVINFCTNMSIISTGLYVVSMVTSGIFIGRLPIYCSLYGYILLPWEIENLFVKETKKIVYIILVGGYLAYYYYQMHFAFGII